MSETVLSWIRNGFTFLIVLSILTDYLMHVIMSQNKFPFNFQQELIRAFTAYKDYLQKYIDQEREFRFSHESFDFHLKGVEAHSLLPEIQSIIDDLQNGAFSDLMGNYKLDLTMKVGQEPLRIIATCHVISRVEPRVTKRLIIMPRESN